MAQSALTVTPPSPTPPTNFSCTGATGANPPNFTKVNYTNPQNFTTINTPLTSLDGRPQSPYGVNPNPPPYFDDGSALTTITFAANTAALASGTGATSGGTENTYPGTDATGLAISDVGAVPASTSVAHEGAGTETLFTQTYNTAVMVPGSAATYLGPSAQTPVWADGAAGGPLRAVGCGPNNPAPSVLGGPVSPNQSHASSLSPATNPTISATPATALSPSTIASGTNTFALTVTGVGFTKQSVVYINGIPQTTVFVSSTSLTVAAALKKTTAGTLPVTVVTGGVVVTTNAPNMTYT